MQVGKLLMEMLFPDFFHRTVRLVVEARPVQVAFGIFVHQQAFQPGALRIQQRAVLRHVLLFDHADLLVELPAAVAFVKRGDVHIIVHGLLLGGGDDGGVQFRDGRGLFEAAGAAHAVKGMAVLRYGGAAGHDLGIAAHKALGVDAVLHVQQVRVAVQMVEVLQQRELHHLYNVWVRLPLGQDCRQVHRELFVADGRFQRRFVDGLEAGDALLLLLLYPARQRQLAPQVVVRAVAVELVAEPHGLIFGAVHQDDTHLGVGVHLVFVVRAGVYGAPVHQARVHGRRFFQEGIHTVSPFFFARKSAASSAAIISGERHVYARVRKHGIITSKPPLARLRVCKAHASVPAHRALRTLNHAKPQWMRFC